MLPLQPDAMILCSTPPPFDSRLVVLFDSSAAVAPQGWNSPANYAVRTIRSLDARLADWQSGKLRWCYVEEIPALVASDAREGSAGTPGLASELSAARERIAALETSAAQAIAALKQTSP